jgi:hypothetical protein
MGKSASRSANNLALIRGQVILWIYGEKCSRQEPFVTKSSIFPEIERLLNYRLAIARSVSAMKRGGEATRALALFTGSSLQRRAACREAQTGICP